MHGKYGPSSTSLDELSDCYLKVYGLVDALVHRHLFLAPFAKSDEELETILANLSLYLRKINRITIS